MQYSKLFAAVAATVFMALAGALTDDVIRESEWINISIATASALLVFTSPNVPGARYTKFIVTLVLGGLAVAQSAITGGIAPAEWLQIAIAALGAVGVVAFPNKTASGVNLSDVQVSARRTQNASISG